MPKSPVNLPLIVAVSAVVAGIGCSHKPPADFAPDPGFIRGMRQIRITTSSTAACPGGLIGASYEAQLESGLWYPFANRYDKKRPPKLHVVFLNRTSLEAAPLENGNWATAPDPTVSAMSGFRLTAFMRDNPTVQGVATIPPDYSCMPHSYSFEGEPGEAGEAGGNGPDITVRIRFLKSPFYQRLVVAEVDVGAAPPFFVFADADQIPPADWLMIETSGGRGGHGVSGARGQSGANGASGCPGSPGGAGGPGGPGGPGGAGGRGGRIQVIVPSEEPLLAGLVDPRSTGGPGGPGGPGGAGGAGGKGGAVQGRPGQQCQAGATGSDGSRGKAGYAGPDSYTGPRATILSVPQREVFGAYVPNALGELISYTDSKK